MHPQNVVRCSTSKVQSDASGPQGGDMPAFACLFGQFSPILRLGRSQAAKKMNRGRDVAEAAIATFGERWSRRCQTQYVPFWRFTWSLWSPLAPPRSTTTLSMSTNRKSRSSRPIPANTSRRTTTDRAVWGCGYPSVRAPLFGCGPKLGPTRIGGVA